MMQAQAGVVIPMILPQALSAPPSYHDNQVQTAPIDTMATISVATQIEEAHSTTNNGQVCAPQTDNEDGEDKKAIYRHPLFPLMALLLEKCEQATQTPECPSSDSFDVDIQAFVHRQEQERRPFFSDDLELDGLMVKAIQVLRIHLLELEKVSELCKDFCTRYITCLKGKLQSENLLRTEIPGYDGDTDDCLLSPGRPSAMNSNNNNNVQLVPNSNVNLVLQGSVAPPPASLPVGGLGQGQVVSGGTVYQMVQTPQGLVAQPIQIQSPTPGGGPQTPNTPVVHGSTPLSQIGLQAVSEVPTQHSPSTPSLPKDFNFDDDDYGKRKNKRGILPKQATQVMKSWLFQHIVHPYPTEDEKRQIAGQTNLTMLQVNNWFINARRRILQPMLDASNPEGVKAKKTKPQQTRPVQRFWPENLANYQLQSGSNSANQLPDSPSSSQSPTCSSSPNLTLQVSVEEEDLEDEEEEDDEDDGTFRAAMSSAHALANSHPQSTMGPQIIVQNDGTLHNLLPSMSHQPSSLVSSTSPAPSSLNLIADAAVGGIHQNTNFLPYVSTHHPPSNLVNVVSTVASHGRDGSELESDNRPEVVEASSMTH